MPVSTVDAALLNSIAALDLTTFLNFNSTLRQRFIIMHPVPDEKPLQNGGVCWFLTDPERKHIATMLDTEVNTLAHITGNVMTTPREICNGCGKRSGIDDMVENAYALGIQNKDFMLKVLIHGPTNESPAHPMSCSECKTQFKGEFKWRGSPFTWQYTGEA